MTPPDTTPSGRRGPAALKTRLIVRVSVLSLALLLLAMGLVSYASLSAFEDVVVPTFNREAEAVAGALAAQIGRALDLGIPAPELVGMAEFLEPALRTRDGFAFIAVTDPAGTVLHQIGSQLDVLTTAAADGRLAPALAEAARGLVVLPTGDLQTTLVPIPAGGEVPAFLAVGVDRGVLEALARDTAWEVAAVLVVCLILTAELLAFVVDRSVSASLRVAEHISGLVAAGDWRTRLLVTARDETGRFLRAVNSLVGRVNDHWSRLGWMATQVSAANPRVAARVARVLAAVGRGQQFAPDGKGPVLRRLPSPLGVRTPLFIFVFAEGLQTSFLPLYARDLPQLTLSLEAGLAAGLPITVFMAGIVAATPLGGGLARRFGARTLFLWGSVPAALGHLICALAPSVVWLLAGRFVTALGYALCTVAAQAYLAQVTAADRRTRGMAVFVGAVMGGTACGAAVGAVLADRIGPAGSFAVAAALVTAAALLARHAVEETVGTAPAEAPRVRTADVVRAVTHPRFLALVLLVAIPAKIFLTGAIFYLAPLYLTDLGLSQPAVGRTVMAYALVTLLTLDLSAWATDRWRVAPGQIVLAGLVTGAGTLALLAADPATALLLAIIAYGVAQGLSAAPMLALVPDICRREAAALGPATLFAWLRLSERIGSMAGPLIAGALLAREGASATILWLGAACAAGAILYGLVEILATRRGAGGPRAQAGGPVLTVGAAYERA